MVSLESGGHKLLYDATFEKISDLVVDLWAFENGMSKSVWDTLDNDCFVCVFCVMDGILTLHLLWFGLEEGQGYS